MATTIEIEIPQPGSVGAARWIVPDLRYDDEPFAEAGEVDPDQFLLALDEPGTYDLFMCGCGMRGCVTVPADVIHDDGGLTIAIHDEPTTRAIPWDEAIEVAQRLVDAVGSLRAAGADVVFFGDTCGDTIGTDVDLDAQLARVVDRRGQSPGGQLGGVSKP